MPLKKISPQPDMKKKFTPKSIEAMLLMQGIQIIHRDGWKGYATVGRVCISTCTLREKGTIDATLEQEERADEFVQMVLGVKNAPEVWAWNDAKGRKRAEVFAALEKAARLADKEAAA